ncbi:MAG: hypothetical protein DWQ01_00155 [Planctomycetota bacterium]|nr:MAG: hypothetical protein DWQ01_00155 [Planctomycetota bacterium]
MAPELPSEPPAKETISGETPAGESEPQFGDYVLLEEVARGGMGVVYRAEQKSLGRIVALKMILAGRLATPDQVERFQAEARAAAQLRHPNIVRILDVGCEKGQHFFTMEFIDGQPLSARLKDGPVPPRRAATLIRQAARALDYAHQCGIVHRDVKPSNILVDQNRKVWLTDFGLAKAVGVEQSLTLPGDVLGTPNYVSPEVASGNMGQVGPLADIYGLGAAFYTLLSGRPPFMGNSFFAVLKQIQDRDPISLAILVRDIPKDLQTICEKCLRREPEKRYSTAEDLAADLEAWLEGRPIQARPTAFWERAAMWTKRNPTLAWMMMAFLALGAVSFLSVTWSWREAVTALQEKETAEDSRLTTLVESLIEARSIAIPGLLQQLVDYEEAGEKAVRKKLITSREARDQERLHLAMLFFGRQDVREIGRSLLNSKLPVNEFSWRLQVLRDWKQKATPRECARLLQEIRQVSQVKDPNVRFRATAAQYFLDDDFVFDQESEAEFAGRLLQEHPLLWSNWVRLFPSLPLHILRHVEVVFRSGSGEAKYNAARLLVRFGGQQKAFLASLLSEGDEDQYRILISSLKDAPEILIPAMEAVLSRRPWNYQPEAAPAPEWKREWGQAFLQAKGRLYADFAWCAAMVEEDFLQLVEEMRPAGFRPLHIRPYLGGGRSLVAASWTRDHKPWSLAWRRPAPELMAQVEDSLLHGLEPVDAFCLVDTAGHGPRFGVLWGPKHPDTIHAGVLLGSSFREYKQGQQDLQSKEYYPVSTQIQRQLDGALSMQEVWLRRPVPRSVHSKRMPMELLFQSDLFPGYWIRNTDLSLIPSQNPEFPLWHGHLRLLNTLWLEPLGVEHRLFRAESFAQLVQQAEQVTELGYRPASILVEARPGSAGFDLEAEDVVTLLSLWHRTNPSREEVAELDRAQATALWTLLQLPEQDRHWQELLGDRRAGLRAQFSHQASKLKVPISFIFERLQVETEPLLIQALLLAGSGYRLEDLRNDEKELASTLLVKFGQEHPDSGVHQAADFLARKWDLKGEPAGITLEQAEEKGLNWFQNVQGQPMVVLQGPGEILIGDLWNQGRAKRHELPRLVQLDRRFAISATEVSQKQFREFEKNHPALMSYLSASSKSAMEGVTLLSAMAYCNWLSHKEGIPEQQHCYPQVNMDNFSAKEVVDLPQDWIERRGYRLPTEEEWEFAARGGAASPYAFGFDPGMLPRFEICRQDGRDRPGPTGERWPNGFGLFDLSGNVREWCFSPLRPELTPNSRGGASPEFVAARISTQEEWLIKGGSFDDSPRQMELARRRGSYLGAHLAQVGFRVARTLEAKEANSVK